MKVITTRKRTVELEDSLTAETYDSDRVTLRYFPASAGEEGAPLGRRMTVPVGLLEEFCRNWLKR